MFTAMQNSAIMAKIKVDAWFKRMFNEQAGGAEVIATLVIIAVVLVLALAFRDNISTLVKSLWNGMLKVGKNDVQPTIPDWT